MEETIRLFFAYAELIIGIPLILAKLILLVPSFILTKLLLKTNNHHGFVNSSVEGFIAILLTCQIFDHYEIQIAWTVPVILIFVRSIWHRGEEQGIGRVASIIGVIVGFLLYPGGLDSIISHFN